MKNKKKRKRWTVIFIGDNRQLGTFNITGAIVVIFLLFILSLATVAFAAYLLNNQKHNLAREVLSRELEFTQNLLSSMNQKNLELAANIKTLEDKLTATAKKDMAVVKKSPAPPLPRKEEIVVDTVKEPPPPEVTTADITNFKIRHKDRNSISYSFRIRNADTENAPVSGYIFAILKPDPGEPSSWVSNPKTTFINGMPQHFKSGEYFSINRYKTTRGRFEKLSKLNTLDIMTILVFSNNGKLILERDYKI